MLECFVDKLKGRKPRTWVDSEDSIATQQWIDKIYEKVSASHREGRLANFDPKRLVYRFGHHRVS